MDLKINESYKIFLDINSHTLVYNAKIIEIEDNFITFIDDRNQKWTYNKKYIISYKKLDYEIKLKERGNDKK